MYPWTLNGIAVLGSLIKSSREVMGWSQIDLRDQLLHLPEPYRYVASDTTIGKLESGRVVSRHNLLVAIAELRFVRDHNGTVLSWDEINATAQQYRLPTGRYELPPGVTPSLRLLLLCEFRNSGTRTDEDNFRRLSSETSIPIERLHQIVDNDLSIEDLNPTEVQCITFSLSKGGCSWTADQIVNQLY